MPPYDLSRDEILSASTLRNPAQILATAAPQLVLAS